MTVQSRYVPSVHYEQCLTDSSLNVVVEQRVPWTGGCHVMMKRQAGHRTGTAEARSEQNMRRTHRSVIRRSVFRMNAMTKDGGKFGASQLRAYLHIHFVNSYGNHPAKSGMIHHYQLRSQQNKHYLIIAVRSLERLRHVVPFSERSRLNNQRQAAGTKPFGSDMIRRIRS